MVKINTPTWMVVLSMMFFLIMPYHILFSITIVKDVMWSCFVVLFIVFFYRVVGNMGSNQWNTVALLINGLGVCLFRSNGFFVFVGLTIIYILLWKNRNTTMLIVFWMIIVTSFVLKHPVLKYLNVPQPDTIESLSIPSQQIARVIKEGHDLDSWEIEALSDIVDIDKIPSKYDPGYSDPIKNLVRERGRQDLLVDKKTTYIKLYFSIGRKYPLVFIRAWVDQTKGYWNAGYKHHVWYTVLEDNPYGVKRVVRNENLKRELEEYLFCYTNLQILKLFISIGLVIWIHIILLFISVIRKDRIGMFVTSPILITALSLIIATPVYSDFRYIYPAFCALPIVAVIVLRPINTSENV